MKSPDHPAAGRETHLIDLIDLICVWSLCYGVHALLSVCLSQRGALDSKMRNTHTGVVADDDWRDSVSMLSILAALEKISNDAAAMTSADRVMAAPREIRIYNLTDSPLLCQIVDFDGANVNGGRMIVPGWFDGSTIALGSNGTVCTYPQSLL